MNRKHVYEKVHYGCHCSYLGAAVLEAHGLYSWMAALLLMVMLCGLFIGASHE